MNRENLQKLADFIKTVPQEIFDMTHIRIGQTDKPECDSVGCVIGHATILWKEEDLPRNEVSGTINFPLFWREFSGLDLNVFDASYWIVSATWRDVDNTPLGASKRIEWLLNHGVPENWDEQMKGNAKLCYN